VESCRKRKTKGNFNCKVENIQFTKSGELTAEVVVTETIAKSGELTKGRTYILLKLKLWRTDCMSYRCLKMVVPYSAR
jgi:hypothetical protein